MPHSKEIEKLRLKFWPKVECGSEKGCWNWRGTISDGYGRLGKSQAHRVSWRINRGTIPAGKWILHKCDNRRCVNPDHLFVGNAQVNVDDMFSKCRQRHVRGEDCKSAKLTAEKVKAIRALAGKMRQEDMVKEFGVSIGAINRALRNVTWRSVK